jgi:hypothetical protein
MGEPVLAIQDATSLNCNAQTKMEGIGHISDKTLGALSQPPYNRPRPSDKTRAHGSKKVRTLGEKESYRRAKALGESAHALPEGTAVVTVCCREGDMHELFDEADRESPAFLIRIAQNWETVGNKKTIDEIRAKPWLRQGKNEDSPQFAHRGERTRSDTADTVCRF